MGCTGRIGAWILAFAFSTIVSAELRAGDFTYDVNYFGLTGDLVTSCDTCTLNSSNVLSWEFSGQGVNINSSLVGAKTLIVGDGLRAAPSFVSFAFAPNTSLNTAVFWANDSVNLFNFASTASQEFMNVGEIDVCYGSSIIYSGASSCSGSNPGGTQTIATQAVTSAPELDPRSLMASLTLLLGCVAVLLGRRLRAVPNA